ALEASKRALWWAVGLVFASAGVLVLFSEKFTGLFSILVLSVTGAYCTAILHRAVRLRLLRLLLILGAVAAVLLGVVSAGYMIFYGYTPGNVLAKVTDRALGLQGHVWFGTDRALQSGEPLGPMSALFPPSGYQGLTGNQELMYLVAPSNFVDAMIHQGLRFSNGGFPLAVWVFGYGWAALYLLLAAAVTGGVLAYLLFSVSRIRFFSVFVALNALRQVTNAFLVGDATDLYKPLALATWLWIALDMAYLLFTSRRQARALPSDSA
ncbi:MAG TPA: DUF6418 domain-containing protein, partial [Coriobacteriia bacterium]|nr:DUF6418 domain-containing protein [Coriobacteriia bacterium]